ncbi:hypothetical protein [Bifidobacterium adolescentis]|uniref:hypothetical protein n=1 Tax=Bifidobacterium adolescentis TaxID=1680 RepID=UPI0015C44577|nr:hypothetical protein [Bifidobacterium adolescentis]
MLDGFLEDESPTPGEGKNSWLTGTAAWTFVDASQYPLGVRPTLDGLAIEPHLPARFTHLTVTRVYRGATYHITMDRTGQRSVAVDGRPLDGDTVPIPTDTTKPVEVTVTF